MSVVTTGIVVQTTKHWSSVTICIDDRIEPLTVSQLQFYSFNVQCEEDMTNLLEEGMEVQVCYEVLPDNATLVECAWVGDPPDVLDVKDQKPVYDQLGVFSFTWEHGFFIHGRLGEVFVERVNFFRNGRRASVTATAQDEVWFDALPAKDLAKSSAKYVATCAWVGRKPTVVERSWPQLEETFEVTCSSLSVAGTVGVIISESVAIADAQLFGRHIKVLVLRKSFSRGRDRLQDVVNVGDILSMRIKYCYLFQGRRIWYAEKTFNVTLDSSFESVFLARGENEHEIAAVDAATTCVVTRPGTCKTRSVIASSLATPSLTAVTAKTTCVEPDLNRPWTQSVASSSRTPRIATVGKNSKTMCVEPVVLNCTRTLETGRSVLDSGWEKPSPEAVEVGTSCAGPIDLSCTRTLETGETVFASGLEPPRLAFKAKTTCIKPLDLSCPGTLNSGERVVYPSCKAPRFETAKAITSYVEAVVLSCSGTPKTGDFVVESDVETPKSETAKDETTCIEPTVLNCPVTPETAQSVADSDFETPRFQTVKAETTCVEPASLNCPVTPETAQSVADSDFETPRFQTVKAETTCVEPTVLNCPVTPETAQSVADYSGMETPRFGTVQDESTCAEPVLFICSGFVESAESVVDSDLETSWLEAVRAETACVEEFVFECPETVETAENEGDSGLETPGLEAVRAETACVEEFVFECPETVETAENEGDSGLETSRLEAVTYVERFVLECLGMVETVRNEGDSGLETPGPEAVQAATTCVEPLVLSCPTTVDTAGNRVDAVLKTPIPEVLYQIPPLTGIITQYKAHACIYFGNFKIFLHRSNLFIDGKVSGDFLDSVLGASGKGIVKFEAVKTKLYPEFTHEATFAWLGEKPDLVTIASILPAPKFELLKEKKQMFYGIVHKLLLPDVALIAIPGLLAVVAASASDFNGLKVTSKSGCSITDCVGLYNCVEFLVRKRQLPEMLCARNIRRLQCRRAMYREVREGLLCRRTKGKGKKRGKRHPNNKCTKKLKTC